MAHGRAIRKVAGAWQKMSRGMAPLIIIIH